VTQQPSFDEIMTQDSIYMPPAFKGGDLKLAQTLMLEHPLATLVSVTKTGEPKVTHLPLQCQLQGEPTSSKEMAPAWILRGHFAKSNPQVQALQHNPQALAIFMGPQGYMSPSVYPDLVRVPTWNYLTLHVQGDIEFVLESEKKDHLLKQLIADHEESYAQQWRALPEAFQDTMLSAIVGFSMKVKHYQFKMKLNQHRPEAHEKMHAQYASGNASEQGLALWMERLGMVTPSPFESVHLK
jgi:transcriptional regulator